MNVKIPAPNGCDGTSIPLSDIIRIETRSLSFFETCAYNLYIILGVHQKEEAFSLFTYRDEKDMLRAYNTIDSLLKAESREKIVLEMEPMRA